MTTGADCNVVDILVASLKSIHRSNPLFDLDRDVEQSNVFIIFRN